MNKTTCPHISFDFTGRFLPPVYILVFIIGLTANVIGLKTLLQNWTKLKIINVFVLNLGLADILYLLTLPFLVVYHLKKNKWIFGDIFCKITRFCFNINLYGSIGFLTCISVSRYLAIVHPVRVMGRLTASHSVVASAIIWVLVSVQCLPDMFFAKTYRKGAEKCFDSTSNTYVEGYLKYSLAWTLTGFCLPFLITLGCYTHVIVRLCGSSSTDTDRVLKRRSLRLLLVLILLFSVCYIPYHVLRNLNLYSRVLSKRRQCYGWFNPVYVAQQVGRGLVCLNPALNPLVYLHVSEEISSGLRTLMGRTRSVLHSHKMSSIVGHPSQAQAPAHTQQRYATQERATPEHATP
ncbi:P2Y purinoceptor 1 [Periophthalmus magnuspinnatus]|uniref:P2Y purinoceptor 1 n=1 Tax=Periophthalmus magnuspinnatus TaxID=409849 RepID=UPI00145B2098|nr:P2Y purinoceptor 1 [Periophthalmus magnuspinnatus]